jgi:hypothetical protein
LPTPEDSLDFNATLISMRACALMAQNGYQEPRNSLIYMAVNRSRILINGVDFARFSADS